MMRCCDYNIIRRRPSTISFFFRLFLLCSTTTLLPFVNGYASWLRCYVELDESEVVMHQYIIPADDSTDVSIEVQEYGESTEWLSSSSSSGEYSTPTTSTTTLTTTPFNIKVRLNFPDYLLRQDVQYVIEIVSDDDEEEEIYNDEQQQNQDQQEDSKSPAVGAEFIDRGVMCDGQRAFSRSSDHVVLQIFDVTKPIELVAGYAPGMEAVRLTPKFIINNSNNNQMNNTSSSSSSSEGEGEDNNNNEEDDGGGGSTTENNEL